eukprot:CAMPEP_0183293548 /NCGR_PEP_ID=MMETSP0160_2-20130417/2190_1 /TAXON_ID=2839 ORGANISM="Odontella Sinensis, Strain Grunow 1884" /NCGR_SAMPLE_ID=MMETSP0160_2 /ASSEMBLY_ACC=CAM_ASM_000250 /LENGTH=451 /DNA_ID=CAMNT_0025454681 /DNA_START=12 /DNA_END=1367 /DNA_ORIENTATION=-
MRILCAKIRGQLATLLVLGTLCLCSSFAPPTVLRSKLQKNSLDHYRLVGRSTKGNIVPTRDDDGGTDQAKEALEMAKTDNKVRSPITFQETIMKTFDQAMEIVSKNRAAITAAIILFLAVFLTPLPSLAVGSGGRMGGSFGPSEQSSSGRTYSAPSSSYGRGYSRGFSSGYYSRPSVIVSPPVVTTPYFSPFTPFYSPFWAPRPSGVIVSTGPSFFGIFGLFAVALVALSVFTSAFGNAGRSIVDTMESSIDSALGPGISVAQLSVALDVPNRDDPNSILNVLSRLSDTARTDSRVGIQNLTSQVALELLRRKQSIVSSASKYTHFKDSSRASREFNKLAVKERGKFERETVSKYGGVDYSQKQKQADLTKYSAKATMAVVTIILAIEGDSTVLPQIRSPKDVEDALSRIASDARVDKCLQSAEILWTPEERSETLTMRDVTSDYPSLRTI